MPAPSHPHTYHREVSRDRRSSLSVIGDQISAPSCVLDVGCGTGALGRYLRARPDIVIDGITINEQEAAIARPDYRKMLIADLEAYDLAQYFEAGAYDFIVCADILEHLRQPKRLLAELTPLLRQNGRLLISVPNLAYCGLIAELLAGEFRYRPEGLLDETHVHFFTRQSALELMRESGLYTVAIHAIPRELWDSEFDPLLVNTPPSVRKHIFSRNDAFTYQFVISAAKALPEDGTLRANAPDNETGNPNFTVALYWGTTGYTDQQMVVTKGVIGEERQIVVLDLPLVRDSPPSRIRLDPADHSGIMSIYSIRLVDSDGGERWVWDHQVESLSSGQHHQVEFGLPSHSAGAITLSLTGNDPFLELPIPPQSIHSSFTGNTRLEVELSWSMSPDYCEIAPKLFALKMELKDAQNKISCLTDEVIHLGRQLKASELECIRTSIELNSILTSTSYRVTRPFIFTMLAARSLVQKVLNIVINYFRMH